jgi:FlaA1/EpsC-like NDP-sugar epimerase
LRNRTAIHIWRWVAGRPLLVFLDALILFGAFWLAYLARFSAAERQAFETGAYLTPSLLISLFWLVLLLGVGVYRRRSRTNPFQEILLSTNAVSVGVLILVLALVDWKSPLSVNRTSVLVYWASSVTLMALSRWWYFRNWPASVETEDSQASLSVTMRKRLLIILADLGMISLSYYLSFLLISDWAMSPDQAARFVTTLPLVLIIRFGVFCYFGIYSGISRYASINDLMRIVKAVTVGTVIMVLPLFFFPRQGFPRSVFVIDWMLMLLMLGASRLMIRALREFWPDSHPTGRRCLVVGANDAGEMVLRELRKERARGYHPVGVVDADPVKWGLSIHGVPVLGTPKDLPRLVREYAVEEIILALPEATGPEVRQIVEDCRRLGVSFKTVRTIGAMLSANPIAPRLRDVRVEDLMRRAPAQLDTPAITECLADKTVLVTGAGGTIGAELVRQLLRYPVKKIYMLDRAENSLFELTMDLFLGDESRHCEPVIADITDATQMARWWEKSMPQIVFHAAAYKHVPLMEEFPAAAIRNNVMGTRILCELADRFGTETFVFVSTDKVVHPTSVMGASKRVAELFVQHMTRQSSTAFIAVRFGNVLGSAGSVVPLFLHQISRGGPVTVTHRDATRYFMTVEEAAGLVLQAAVIGRPCDTLLLKMGEPLNIQALAEDLIILSGFVPGEDIAIRYIGLRKGEKLHEELRLAEEPVQETDHPSIERALAKPVLSQALLGPLGQLCQAATQDDNAAIYQRLAELVPSYAPAGSVEAAGVAERVASLD